MTDPNSLSAPFDHWWDDEPNVSYYLYTTVPLGSAPPLAQSTFFWIATDDTGAGMLVMKGELKYAFGFTEGATEFLYGEGVSIAHPARVISTHVSVDDNLDDPMQVSLNDYNDSLVAFGAEVDGQVAVIYSCRGDAPLCPYLPEGINFD